MTTYLKASDFAKIKHGDTMRKYGNVPYYTHPFAVAERLINLHPFDSSIIIAAYLHDTVEDTDTTLEEITVKFGKRVSQLVGELTSDKKIIKDRLCTDPMAKAKYLTEKINGMSKEARVIKLADRENNVSDLAVGSKEFALKYATETLYILNHIEITPESYEEEIIQSIQDKIAPFLGD